jgi:transcriptional regulator with XRE-family HTH domain
MGLKFGRWIQDKRLERKITLRAFAERVGIGAGYVSDIENGKKDAPQKEILERMAKVLLLSKSDTAELYDRAAEDKNTVAMDIPDYIKDKTPLIKFLRVAKERGWGTKEWEEFIRKVERDTDD